MIRPTSLLRSIPTASSSSQMAMRAFSSSSVAAFAQPTESPVKKMKEFKIYRWVSDRSINLLHRLGGVGWIPCYTQSRWQCSGGDMYCRAWGRFSSPSGEIMGQSWAELSWLWSSLCNLFLHLRSVAVFSSPHRCHHHSNGLIEPRHTHRETDFTILQSRSIPMWTYDVRRLGESSFIWSQSSSIFSLHFISIPIRWLGRGRFESAKEDEEQEELIYCTDPKPNRSRSRTRSTQLWLSVVLVVKAFAVLAPWTLTVSTLWLVCVGSRRTQLRPQRCILFLTVSFSSD